MDGVIKKESGDLDHVKYKLYLDEVNDRIEKLTAQINELLVQAEKEEGEGVTLLVRLNGKRVELGLAINLDLLEKKIGSVREDSGN